ncbi:hypothetical protein ALT1000_50071 [Alteromonas macleodii]
MPTAVAQHSLESNEEGERAIIILYISFERVFKLGGITHECNS